MMRKIFIVFQVLFIIFLVSCDFSNEKKKDHLNDNEKVDDVENELIYFSKENDCDVSKNSEQNDEKNNEEDEHCDCPEINQGDSLDSANDDPIFYYREHLEDKLYTLNKIKEQNEIDYTFAFITDLHWQSNKKKSPLLLKEIDNSFKIDKVVLGGDYIDYDFEDDSIPRRIMKECVDAFSDFNYTAIVGNHDSNDNCYQGYPRIPDNDIFSIVNNVESEYAYSVEYLESIKLCSLYLNSSIDAFDDEKQKDFVRECLINLDEEWTVLIFIHIVFDSSYQNNNLSVIKPAGKMLMDFLSLLIPELKCTIAGVFSGHSHLDYLNTSDYCCPFITTLCDAYGVFNPKYNIYKREENKYTEQAFDIIQIDLKNRKVYLTRIGAGVDRVFTY